MSGIENKEGIALIVCFHVDTKKIPLHFGLWFILKNLMVNLNNLN